MSRSLSASQNKAVEYLRASTWLWAITHKIELPTGGLLRLKNHEYLVEPYDAEAGLLVVLKGAQLGFSEWAVLKTLHDCAFKFSSGVIYYFPTKTDVLDFSKARFGPLISINPVLKKLVSETDAANIKRVGNCMLYLRGLRSPVSAKSAPADRIVFDEIDEAPPEMVDLARKRLDHSEHQEIFALSTPTIPDFGVDSLFQLTDQRYRQIYCEACNKYTCLERDFPDCLAEQRDGSVHRVCRYCRKELDLGHDRNEYVADYPGREWHGKPAIGWRVSQLQSFYVNPALILQEYREGKFPQDFYNSRLAQPWIDAANRLDVSHVLALCGQHGYEHTARYDVAIGVDIGPAVHHIVVARKEYSNTYRVIYLGETDWGGLDMLMERYRGTMVVDGMPEPARVLELAKRHPYRIFACHYTQSPRLVKYWDETDCKIVIYQAEAMDSSHQVLQRGQVLLPRKSLAEVKQFAHHCHNVARRKVEDEDSGNIKYQWIKLGPDHYRKAFNFMVLAAERVGESVTGATVDYGAIIKGGIATSYGHARRV